ncbi:hypothetical protein P175DRAFT_0470242 [Aspergillus ochraceoroseus IBT 24754]|uniref:CCHC-type domain-containing protein n=1 Tax=Aspergillus ochraceoroseus IBT 24754 TaxID=1392256 RepID=A0A2T5M715_9EURO|nr:uncharacterized protein P175DRAFT_0470242 [Aspergillus ochraceoroseus IBT 24754]PTU24328.1 hypothetical protein P175DRAFT_0470242 [Aspergillus ochraceoroseus IBT 24754]
MSDASGDERDSRTASVGLQRNRRNSNVSNNSSRHTSGEPLSKRQRRTRNANTADVKDFVPRGAKFSAASLEVDPESASSSGGEGEEKETETETETETDSSAPVLNWNKGNKSVIRTTLGGRQNMAASAQRDSAESKFEAVNGKFWRSRSASASPERGQQQNKEQDNAPVARDENEDEEDVMEEGQVSEESSVEDDEESDHSQSPLSGDSDDSESLDSEAEDSIMLNIGSRGQSQQNGGLSPSDNDDDDYDPESLPLSQSTDKGMMIFDTTNGMMDDSATDSKESALLRFAQKYPAAPSILADLDREDMERQAKAIFYDRDINDINLQSPITCMECLREGHLADVCPMKECVHCGAWNKHQSSLCPKWRRCQRCRERGHDQKQCSSALKSSASEIPCDLCGSSDHLELDCDFMWKLPRQDTTAAPVLVSISCAHCTSNRHLIGDCPSLPRPLASSSWTLRGIDPNIITNVNSVVNSRRGGGPGAASRAVPGNQKQRGMKIRGRADHARFPSTTTSDTDSDDMMALSRPDRRPQVGGNRNANRGNIRFGNNIGKNKNLGPPPPPPGPRDYRDREDPMPRNNHGRQRSMSPGRPRGGRGRGKHTWQPPLPRSPPPRGNSRPSGPPPRSSRGGRGGGRGGSKRGGGGDAYRPLPSAAKKAWDKYRL